MPYVPTDLKKLLLALRREGGGLGAARAARLGGQLAGAIGHLSHGPRCCH